MGPTFPYCFLEMSYFYSLCHLHDNNTGYFLSRFARSNLRELLVFQGADS